MKPTLIPIGSKVVVATDHNKRGVFFGVLVEDKGAEVTLDQVQMALYWSKASRGFVGLASIGPQAGSRISPPSPRMTLYGVTCLALASDDASKAWEAQPWS